MSEVERATESRGEELGFERLVFFSDAVMAIAITLMALEIRLPELDPEATADQVGGALAGMIPHIEVYLLSFVVIGLYWTVHHRLFRVIRRYDSPLIWLNLIFLMAVGFLPVATNALGIYPNIPAVTAFYAVSISLVGLSEFVLWLYALRKGYMPAYPTSRDSLYFALRVLVPPLNFLLSILLLPLSVDLAKFSWAVMIPIFLVFRFVFRSTRTEPIPSHEEDAI